MIWVCGELPFRELEPGHEPVAGFTSSLQLLDELQRGTRALERGDSKWAISGSDDDQRSPPAQTRGVSGDLDGPDFVARDHRRRSLPALTAALERYGRTELELADINRTLPGTPDNRVASRHVSTVTRARLIRLRACPDHLAGKPHVAVLEPTGSELRTDAVPSLPPDLSMSAHQGLRGRRRKPAGKPKIDWESTRMAAARASPTLVQTRAKELK